MNLDYALIAVFAFVVILLLPPLLVIAVRPIRYWATSSKKKSPFEFIITWATVWGVLAAGITLYFLYEDASAIKENQNVQAYSNVYQAQLGLDQVEEQNAALTPYFERNKPLKINDPDADRIRLIAEHKLDVIDYFFSQQGNVKLKDDEYDAWLYYFKSSFVHSQVLCDVLRERRRSYGNSIAAVAWHSGCKGFSKPNFDLDADLANYFKRS